MRLYLSSTANFASSRKPSATSLSASLPSSISSSLSSPAHSQDKSSGFIKLFDSHWSRVANTRSAQPQSRHTLVLTRPKQTLVIHSRKHMCNQGMLRKTSGKMGAVSLTVSLVEVNTLPQVLFSDLCILVKRKSLPHGFIFRNRDYFLACADSRGRFRHQAPVTLVCLGVCFLCQTCADKNPDPFNVAHRANRLSKVLKEEGGGARYIRIYIYISEKS